MTAAYYKRLTQVLSTGLILIMGAGHAIAGETGSTTVPMTITVTDVIETQVPLYISVQTEADYRSMKGEGTILRQTTAGTITETVQLPAAGDYAISIWHDLDNDGRFSMNERYEVLDGWGSSGETLMAGAPTFQSAKISVPNFGAETSVAMIYPKP